MKIVQLLDFLKDITNLHNEDFWFSSERWTPVGGEVHPQFVDFVRVVVGIEFSPSAVSEHRDQKAV